MRVWVVLHYYAQGNFPTRFRRDGASQKQATTTENQWEGQGRTGLIRAAPGGVQIALQQGVRRKKYFRGSRRAASAARHGNAASWPKKKLSRGESANLKGDLGKFEETAASPSRAGYGSLPTVI